MTAREEADEVIRNAQAAYLRGDIDQDDLLAICCRAKKDAVMDDEVAMLTHRPPSPAGNERK